jgi:hypothetical protein
VSTDRDATPIIGHSNGAVLQETDLDVGGVPSHRFVDRVVDDFPDQVMQTTAVGRADVHARSSTDRVEAL